ncbi:MAG TPA: DUF4149 domain-containing protein [Polyangiales bacterium]
MGSLYLVSVWLHILAATAWLGGMIFLVLVAVPVLRRGDPKLAAIVMRDSGRRFRDVGWVCFGILAITGTFNLWWRGVRVSNLLDATWAASVFGRTLWLKLSAFLVVLALSVAHDFFIGPRASEELARDPQGARAPQLRRAASLMGRATALLALIIFALAVVLVRGPVW